MSDQEATRFIDDLQTDVEFLTEMSKLKGNPDAAFNAVISRGYDVTKEEITEAYLEFASSNLSDNELNAVAAGLSDAATIGIAVGGAAGGMAAAAITTGIVLAVVASSSAAACI